MTEYDRIKYQGTVYDVDGKPGSWFGRLGYVEIHLKKRSG